MDGFRLDAVRHLIEDGDVMNDTPETIAWLQGFQAHVKRVAPARTHDRRGVDGHRDRQRLHPRRRARPRLRVRTRQGHPRRRRVRQQGQARLRARQRRGQLPGQSLRHHGHQPRPGPHRERARRGPGAPAARGRPAAHAAGRAVPLLRRGDRPDRREARRDDPQPDAVDRGPERRLHRGRAAVGKAAEGPRAPQRRGAGRGSRLAAQPLSPAGPAAPVGAGTVASVRCVRSRPAART